jgi:hypothetical protein
VASAEEGASEVAVALAEAAVSEVAVDSAAVMEALATTKRSPARSIWRPVRVVIDRSSSAAEALVKWWSGNARVLGRARAHRQPIGSYLVPLLN